jgi:NhaA family Na+:H+ antiporter
VHPTIAGVALGLVFSAKRAGPARHAIEPWSNVVILPLFAFTASLVVLPGLALSELSPVFWGIAIALPVGKLVGITAGSLLARAAVPRSERADSLALGEILVVASLGGIGFTVSLLMNELAFENLPDIAAQGTIAVLIGSIAAAVIALVVTTSYGSVLRRRARS